MPTEAVAVIPEPAGPPTLEAVPDLPAVAVADIAAGITAALVTGWNAIRARHPDVPEAVISMATGGRMSAVELAHFWPRKWRAREGDTRHHEVFVTAESLADGAPKVFGYLLHEATHAANEHRNVDDCSASQYHNKEFRKTAAELGLVQQPGISDKRKKKYGFADTDLRQRRRTPRRSPLSTRRSTPPACRTLSSTAARAAARAAGLPLKRTATPAGAVRRRRRRRRRRTATTSRRSAGASRLR